MKKNVLSKPAMIVIVAFAIALASCLLLAACGTSAQTSGSKAASTEVAAGQPPLQPAGAHEQRWDMGGTKMCYGCHGAGEKSNPILASAPAIPADHYQSGDASTKQLQDGHTQCIQCHPVAQS